VLNDLSQDTQTLRDNVGLNVYPLCTDCPVLSNIEPLTGVCSEIEHFQNDFSPGSNGSVLLHLPNLNDAKILPAVCFEDEQLNHDISSGSKDSELHPSSLEVDSVQLLPKV
jgi:hypothetical protein